MQTVARPSTIRKRSDGGRYSKGSMAFYNSPEFEELVRKLEAEEAAKKEASK